MVKDLHEEIFGAASENSQGKRTRKLLEMKGIKSPPISKMIRVDERTWIVPKDPSEDPESVKLRYYSK